MPPVAVKGPPAIYCKPSCRKAAYEARRRNDSTAFEVKVVTTERIGEHPLGTCVDRALASPRAFRRMVESLTEMLRDGDMSDPKWELLREPLVHLQAAMADRDKPPRTRRW